MGFVSGFVSTLLGDVENTLSDMNQTGGVTLTLGIAYLTVYQHERIRSAQAHHLRTQSHLLTTLIDPPQNAPAPLTRAEVARQERSTITERAKDRWNEEIEKSIRFVQTTNWNEVRESLEDQIARLWGGGLERTRESISKAETRAQPVLEDAGRKAQAGAQRAKDEGHRLVNDAAKGTISGAEEAKVYVDGAAGKAKAGLDQAGHKAGDVAKSAKQAGEMAFADAKTKTQGAETATKDAWGRSVEKSTEVMDKATSKIAGSGPGTVDILRSKVSQTVSKGIEKGKELVGKAQEKVGIATEKAGAAIGSATEGLSAEEKALRERYEPMNGLNQTVEQALAARYVPEDQRDHSHLRGV